jgi:hypothetical protein
MNKDATLFLLQQEYPFFRTIGLIPFVAYHILLEFIPHFLYWAERYIFDVSVEFQSHVFFHGDYMYVPADDVLTRGLPEVLGKRLRHRQRKMKSVEK